MKTNAAGARFHRGEQPSAQSRQKRAHRLSLRSTAGIEAEEKDAASLRPDQNGRSRDALTVHLFLKAINK
jgi:hypothetical protein